MNLNTMEGPTQQQSPPSQQQSTNLLVVRAKLKNLLKYLATGLLVALVISRMSPGFSHCLKQKCGLVLTVMNVGVFWGVVAGWPFVLAGLVLGKLTFLLNALV